MDKTEQSRLRVKRYRDRQKRVTSDSVTGDSVTLLSRPNRLGATGLPEMVANDYNPDEMLPDGRKRYSEPLSDGQVLDRMTVKSAYPDNVGSESGQYPFYGLRSVIFTPNQRR